MPKKVLLAIPPSMLEQCDYIAQCEHRTRSDLLREALRRYMESFKRSQAGNPMIMNLVDSPHPAALT
jgi:metal-responsive CopG/Arc/MetJ family transcriptional regulator